MLDLVQSVCDKYSEKNRSSSPIKHFLSLSDSSRYFFESLFSLASEIEHCKSDFDQALSSRVLGTLFFDSSTRTRISFETAMLRLGGNVTGFSDVATTRATGFFGESLADTVRVMSEMADCLVFRHKDIASSRIFLEHASVPVINGGNGQGEHPTQAILDLWMMHRHFGSIDNLTIGLFGNPNWRSMNSFYHAIRQFEPKKLILLTPPGVWLSDENLKILQENAIAWEYCKSVDDLIACCDVIETIPFYLPRFDHVDAISQSTLKSIEQHYIINRKKMQNFGLDKLLLHIGPRGREISPDVDDCPQAQYFTQVRQSIYMRMAILLKLINQD